LLLHGMWNQYSSSDFKVLLSIFVFGKYSETKERIFAGQV
jgi:hypothetical protein